MHTGQWICRPAYRRLLFLTVWSLVALSPASLFAQSKANAQGVAIFAGGCFWCMEPPFEDLDGVSSVISGYSGGQEKNPTYGQVSSGQTGHAEVVQIKFNPEVISYRKLLSIFWRNIDPEAKNRQFCDSGRQYRSGIYYLSAEQKQLAEESLQEVEKSGRVKTIHTEILPATEFYPAEEYHQDYYKKNPLRYKVYRSGCGRDRRLREIWGESG